MFKISYALSIISATSFYLTSCQNDLSLTPKTVELKTQSEVDKMVSTVQKLV